MPKAGQEEQSYVWFWIVSVFESKSVLPCGREDTIANWWSPSWLRSAFIPAPCVSAFTSARITCWLLPHALLVLCPSGLNLFGLLLLCKELLKPPPPKSVYRGKPLPGMSAGSPWGMRAGDGSRGVGMSRRESWGFLTALSGPGASVCPFSWESCSLVQTSAFPGSLWSFCDGCPTRNAASS